MSIITVTLREVRTGITNLSLASEGVPVVAGPLTLANGVTQTFSVIAGTDNFRDTGVPGLQTAQRFLGWVKFDNTYLYLSDAVVIFSAYKPWVISDTMQITLQDIDQNGGTNHDTTFTFTLTGDNAPHTLDISVMPMSVVDSPPELTALWRFDKLDLTDPLNAVIKSDGYRAEYFSWNPITIDADTNTIRVQLMSETTAQITNKGTGKQGSLHDFMYYIETATVNGGTNTVQGLFQLWNYIQFGTPTYSAGYIVIKGLPYTDIVFKLIAQQFPLFLAWINGEAYGVSSGCGVSSVVLPNQQGKVFGEVGGGDPHWDLREYPRQTIAIANAEIGLAFAKVDQPILAVDCTVPANVTLYAAFLAGTATRAQILAALTALPGAITVFYSFSGKAGPGTGFLGGTFIQDPRTGINICTAGQGDAFSPVSAVAVQLRWSYTQYQALAQWYITSPYVGNDNLIYADLDVSTQFIQLFYDTLIGCSAKPPNASIYPVGSDIRVDVSDFYPLSITVFTVNGVDHLGDLIAPLDLVNSVPGNVKYLDATHFLTYTITDALVDQHVVLVAEYQPLNIIPTIPYTVQCHAGCNPAQTWNVSSDPAITAGITIDNTGLINFTLPATVPPETVDIDVTVDDGFPGETAGRHFSIVVGSAPLFGNVWAVAGHVTGTVSAMLALSNGNVIFGTSAGAIFLSTDALQTWGTAVDTIAGPITQIIEDENGVVYAFSGISNGAISTSADHGATWSHLTIVPIAAQNGAMYFGTGHFLTFGGNQSSYIVLYGSSDYGVNWAFIPPVITAGLNYWWGAPGRRTQGDMIVPQADSYGPINFLDVPLAGAPITLKTAITQVGGGVMVNMARAHFLNGGWCAVGSDNYGYFSNDDGVTWVRMGAAAGAMSVILAASNTAIIGGANQFYLSTDNCQTITPAATGTADGTVKCIDRISSNGIMIAGTDGATHNLYRSTS